MYTGMFYGLDVIITDHHEPSDEIPKAVAVIDAKRKNKEKYRYKSLKEIIYLSKENKDYI